MPLNLNEQIWYEDVSDQMDVSRGSAKLLHEWVLRLETQRAPPDLIIKIARIRDMYAETLDELSTSLPWFPKQK